MKGRNIDKNSCLRIWIRHFRQLFVILRLAWFIENDQGRDESKVG
jgi:hypothetical protein